MKGNEGGSEEEEEEEEEVFCCSGYTCSMDYENINGMDRKCTVTDSHKYMSL